MPPVSAASSDGSSVGTKFKRSRARAVLFTSFRWDFISPMMIPKLFLSVSPRNGRIWGPAKVCVVVCERDWWPISRNDFFTSALSSEYAFHLALCIHLWSKEKFFLQRHALKYWKRSERLHFLLSCTASTLPNAWKFDKRPLQYLCWNSYYVPIYADGTHQHGNYGKACCAS